MTLTPTTTQKKKDIQRYKTQIRFDIKYDLAKIHNIQQYKTDLTVHTK